MNIQLKAEYKKPLFYQKLCEVSDITRTLIQPFRLAKWHSPRSLNKLHDIRKRKLHPDIV